MLLNLVEWLSNATGIMAGQVVLPELEWDVAKKLAPVITVNIVGLVFNTLCLRAVDASFFQVGPFVTLPERDWKD